MILYRTDEEEHRISFACFFLHFNIQLESFKFFTNHMTTRRVAMVIITSMWSI